MGFNPFKAITRAVGIPDTVAAVAFPVAFVAGKLGEAVGSAAQSKLGQVLGQGQSPANQPNQAPNVQGYYSPYTTPVATYYPDYSARASGDYLGGQSWDSSTYPTSSMPTFQEGTSWGSGSTFSGQQTWEDRVHNSLISAFR